MPSPNEALDVAPDQRRVIHQVGSHTGYNLVRQPLPSNIFRPAGIPVGVAGKTSFRHLLKHREELAIDYPKLPVRAATNLMKIVRFRRGQHANLTSEDSGGMKKPADDDYDRYLNAIPKYGRIGALMWYDGC